MAESDYAEHIAGEKLLFLFGDGGDPEQFTASCSINTDRSVEFLNDIYQSWRANCTDPSAPSMPVRRVKGKDVKFTGAGMTDATSFKALLTRWNDNTQQVFQGQAIQDLDGGKGWTVAGPWVIENLKSGGARGEEQAFEISISIAGPFEIS